MASGGWSQKEKRKCRKSLSCRGAVEGTPVDLDGESRHEQVEGKRFEKGKKDAQ